MPPAKKLEQGKLLTYEDMLGLFNDFKDEVKRFKVQTGELSDARKQIEAIDRMLRGYNGERGLVTAVDLLAAQVKALTSQQLPAMIAELKESRKGDFERCQEHHDFELSKMRTELSDEIERLRTEYAHHQKQEEDEEKQSAAFGGYKWFREKFLEAPMMLILTIVGTIVVTQLLDLVFARLIK